jgi:hypothetical protein
VAVATWAGPIALPQIERSLLRMCYTPLDGSGRERNEERR